MKIIGVFACLLLVAAISPAALHTSYHQPYDWRLAGVVVYAVEIPNSGGAWALTLAREHPELPGALDYLEVICDHNQPVTKVCANLELFDAIDVSGYVLSMEPHTGQRLSVRTLSLISKTTARKR